MNELDLRPDHYYSNGAWGRDWGVRRILKIEHGLWQGVAGTCRRKRGEATRAEFLVWTKNEVTLNENSWQRVSAPD
jgi:hypothetical protein